MVKKKRRNESFSYEMTSQPPSDISQVTIAKKHPHKSLKNIVCKIFLKHNHVELH